MKQEKICISKSIMIFAAVAVFLLGFVVFTNYLNSQKVGQKPKADEPNPVHVPLESRKISCPVVGEPAAWKQTDGNPPTYYANTGVCAGSDDPAKVYDGTGKFQVCCNEQITFNEYMKINNLSPSINCPGAGVVRKYSYGTDGKCYKIDGKVLWENTPNQTCGNFEMPTSICCSNGGSDYCQDIAPSVTPITVVPITVAPTAFVSLPQSLICPPKTPWEYRWGQVSITTNNQEEDRPGCFFVDGTKTVDKLGNIICDDKLIGVYAGTSCCVDPSSIGCQP